MSLESSGKNAARTDGRSKHLKAPCDLRISYEWKITASESKKANFTQLKAGMM